MPDAIYVIYDLYDIFDMYAMYGAMTKTICMYVNIGVKKKR